ncbi:alpha/beta hydrolase family protein [Aestuariibacter salexigens]|uniref:alpha/beta hydrolase family protein n=1 Tax=Aestuariibacter salexigens TaxID=226010 RepID=UPI00047DEE33|nr:prolyl oligopeptidase family serine peptidase [Aestuariibacter salexigens]
MSSLRLSIVGLFSLLPTLLLVGPILAAPMSLQNMTQMREVMTAEMAPDGKHIAYTVSLPRRVYIDTKGQNHRELYVLDRRSKNLPVMTGNVVVGRVRWLNNHTLIFNARRAEDASTGLYSFDMQHQQLQRIDQQQGDVQSFNLSSNSSILMWWTLAQTSDAEKQLHEFGFDAQVYEQQYPQQTLFTATYDPQEGWYSRKVPVSGHVISAQPFNDGEKMLLVWSDSPTTHDQLLYARLSVMEINGQHIKSFRHAGKLGRVLLSPDNNHIAMIGTNDMSDPKEGRLLIASVDEGHVINLIEPFDGHVRDIAWLSAQRIAFVAHRGVESIVGVKSIDQNSEKFRTLLDNNGIAERITASRDGQDLAIVLHRSKHPREVYWQRGVTAARATLSNPWLRDVQLADQRTLTLTTADNVELQGMYVSPLQKKTMPPPLIMFVHGGPESHISNGWLSDYTQPVHFAASQGFASFLLNYRGSTARGVAFSKAGQGDYAGAEFNDILTAKQFLVERGLADAGKVAIAGISYGGYAAAWAATRFTNHFAVSVSGMGISNQLSKFGTSDIPAELVYQHALQWPWQDWQWLMNRSPVYYANEATTPLLLLHGKQDHRVHYSQSLEMYQHLKYQSDTPVRLVLYPHAGHGLTRAAEQFDYATRMMRWIGHFVDNPQGTQPAIGLDHQNYLPTDTQDGATTTQP